MFDDLQRSNTDKIKNSQEPSPLLVEADVKPGNYLSKSSRHRQTTGNDYSTSTPARHGVGRRWLEDESPPYGIWVF